MKTSHQGAGLLVGLASALALTVVGAAPASAAAPAPGSASASTWTLEAEGQRICVDPEHGWPWTYAFSPVSGTWSTPIQTGVRNLPPGSSSAGGSTIPPGTNERRPDGALVINGFLDLRIAPAPAGEYVAEVWATDGTETQTDPLLIVFRDDC
ncbi:DUF5980 family protein [Streptomyces sp. BBFR51]|uniref:DUF5980 family protein n=1 Tax=Streptomyces sp. BBFR51 TaxID=3372856 RepID=UPI0037DC8C2A